MQLSDCTHPMAVGGREAKGCRELSGTALHGSVPSSEIGNDDVHADRQAAQPASESEQARNQPTNERMHQRTNEETKTTRQSQSVRQTVEECGY